MREVATPSEPEDAAAERRPSRFLSALLCGPLGVLAAVVVCRAVSLAPFYDDFVRGDPLLRKTWNADPVRVWLPRLCADLVGESRGTWNAVDVEGIDGNAVVFTFVALLLGLFLLYASILGLTRKSARSLRRLRTAYAVAYFFVLYYGYVVFRATAVVVEHKAEAEEIARDAVAVATFYARWDSIWPFALAAALVAVAHVFTRTRKAILLYTGEWLDAPAVGDRILENVRTHGRDPAERKSLLGSAGTHLAVIVLLPALLRNVGCVEPYRVPRGSGNPVVAVVRMVKPKKKKRKKYVLRADSAISFHIPDLDESEMLKQVDEDTQLTYMADPNAVHGKLGRGGGKSGGWPDGMDKGKVRFIRLKYDGPGWDDGMSMDPKIRADANFLDFFRKLVPFPVALRGESHPIGLLSKYPKGYAPPFVYMTGHGHIRCSRKDAKIMRDYLLDGGMLFADCGSPGWDRSFRGFIKNVLPDKQLLVIADDDPIFRMPFGFPNGAPPLWHHGGWRALGMKHKGRWCVFYHPGDINDAWKTGHSGIRPDMAKGAFHMGVNIIYYSFTHYLEETRKYRK